MNVDDERPTLAAGVSVAANHAPADSPGTSRLLRETAENVLLQGAKEPGDVMATESFTRRAFAVIDSRRWHSELMQEGAELAARQVRALENEADLGRASLWLTATSVYVIRDQFLERTARRCH